jgi:hypothetical protein
VGGGIFVLWGEKLELGEIVGLGVGWDYLLGQEVCD